MTRMALRIAALTGVPVVLAIWSALRAVANARAFKRLNPTAEIRTYLLPDWLLDLIPPLQIICGRPMDVYKEKYEPYRNTSDDTIVFCGPQGSFISVADPDVIKEVSFRQRDFPKPLYLYKILDVFGRNIVSMEGDEWRAHRKIVAPSFSERNNMLVHEEAVRAVELMFASWDQRVSSKHGGGALVSSHDETMQLALMIIAAAAFGVRLQWEDGSNEAISVPPNHKLSFQQAMKKTVKNLPLYVLVPRSLLSLPIPWFAERRLAYDEFIKYLNEIIDDGLHSASDNQQNLLQLLAKTADESVVDGFKMERSELLGNAFIFIFAGHETTAGTLHFALVNLALHREIQEKLYAEAKSVYGAETGTPAYKDIGRLPYSTAVGYETLRLFPPVIGLAKWTEDVSQNMSRYKLPPRTEIHFNFVASQTNPKVWGDDALLFRPERFIDIDGNLTSTNPRGLTPFSEGPRACVGKRFAQIELAVAISMICSRFIVEPPPDADKVAILGAINRITLVPKAPVQLIVRRR